MPPAIPAAATIAAAGSADAALAGGLVLGTPMAAATSTGMIASAMPSMSTLLGAGSMLTGVAGAAMQGYSQSQALNYQAQVARNNQIVANQNAQIAVQQGTQAEQAQRIKTGEMIGGIEASQGASGVELSSGSPLAVRSSAAETGELDAETIRYNAKIQARNLLYQGAQYGAQAGLYSAQSDWAIANSILGGASSVSDKWLRYSQLGTLSNQPANPMYLGT